MKQYKCMRIKENITIDGNLEKPAWNKAETIHLLENQSGKEPEQGTTAKLLWNDKCLYVAFRCIDDEIVATMKEYNDPIYKEEVVEIFIDDDCDLATYIEIEVNPLNTLLHYDIHNNLKGGIISFARTAKVIETAVVHNKEKGFWDVEMEIPFSELILGSTDGPGVNTRWRINLYRIDRRKNGETELSAWCPTLAGSFHKPDKFGEVIFAE